MKPAVIAGAWALTVVGAFVVGGVMRESASESTGDDTAEVERLRERVEELTAALDESSHKRERVDGGRERIVDAPMSEGGAAPLAEKAEAATDDEATASFTLANATSGPEASRELMAFAELQLERGEAGHIAIMDAIGDIWSNREKLQQLFGDETQAIRELYPWIKFLVEHEDGVIGLSEYVFQTMAEDPMAFEKLPDGDVLEMFTEGVAILLPGAVDEETLGRFRGYARQTLDTPRDEQPKAVAASRSDLERLLSSFWAEPITPEEALAQLKEGKVPTEQIGRLLRIIPPESLAELDMGALLEPLLRKGSRDAVQIMQRNPNLNIDSWRTDQAVISGLSAGTVNAWFLRMYFDAVGHKEWNDVRPFFDRALGAGDKALAAALQALTRYLMPNMRPDAAYIEDVLSRYQIDDSIRVQLKAAYGIED